MRLDRSRTYDQVFGTPGVAFSQGGRLFNTGGAEVVLETTGEGDERRTTAHAVDVEKTAKVEPEPAVNHDEADPRKMHHMKLKALIAQYGEEWIDRETAVAFLEGRQAAA